ncbi:Leucine-rich repeat (LRR) protein [Saonia flava]|uniref:Leucine-rich repeat (LRR) protein n=1 Tax=Saonia flava TaxID=523696 RepID=A0A846R062_9FLAO|nr:leucine-rich repeat domain-containing protein [Saonia flava]NJB70259.1 Leucine-rich repeat (LRR) protein [Saonia flava]
MKTIYSVLKVIIKPNLIFLLVAGLTSCGKDDGPAPIPESPEIVKSLEKEIISFSFLSANNTVLAVDITAIINATAKTVAVNLPSDTALTALTPTFSISPKASISPEGEQDFTNPVTYTITAEDGSTSSYIITATSKSSAKQITSFVFLLTNNPIEVNVVGTIDEENKTISATMPPGTNLSGLLPEIQLSDLATINLTAPQDFTDPLEYIITAEDGSTSTYTVTVHVELTQRQVLQAILDANPESTLNWDLVNTADLGSLSGVTVDVEGNIVKLQIYEKKLSVLPPEIALLTHLTSFSIYGNYVSSFPVELCQLTNLTSLTLTLNQLTALPPEIGQLTNLTYLNLEVNQLTSLPSEIGLLTNLTYLDLGTNQLTSLPSEIWQLTNLTTLSMYYNRLTSLPKEIGLLTNLTFLGLSENKFSILPDEIGLLTNLTSLQLFQNSLVTIPTSIFYLSEFNDLSVLKDDGIPYGNTSQNSALISIYAANPDNTLGWTVDNYPDVTFNTNGNPTILQMGKKGLTWLPVEVGLLTALETLNVNDNSLESFPATLGNINTLNVITAANNKIGTVPAELGQLSNLALLSLTQNPITSIPTEVCDLQVSNGGILTILTDSGKGCD